jgi:hypothetical protein
MVLTEFHFAVLSMVIFAPCLEPVSPGFLKDGERFTYLEVAPIQCQRDLSDSLTRSQRGRNFT